VQVALDDFGSGYSSLSSLSQLPIDILKIDKSFLKAVGRGRASTAIAEGIIALGQSLGLEVIAEGVETAEALAFLRRRHCSRAQGYYFCQPMPAHDFEQWYRKRIA
jgi:sensor c-di-GMP phosphodiesterase-like protein